MFVFVFVLGLHVSPLDLSERASSFIIDFMAQLTFLYLVLLSSPLLARIPHFLVRLQDFCWSQNICFHLEYNYYLLTVPVVLLLLLLRLLMMMIVASAGDWVISYIVCHNGLI